MAEYEVSPNEVGMGVSRIFLELVGHKVKDEALHIETEYGVDADGLMRLTVRAQELVKERSR